MRPKFASKYVLLTAAGLGFLMMPTACSGGRHSVGISSSNGPTSPPLSTSIKLPPNTDTEQWALSNATKLPSIFVSPLNVFAYGAGYTAGTLATYNTDVAQCMASHGWQYQADPTALQIALPIQVDNLIKYRGARGYSSPGAQDIPADPNLTFVNSLSSTQQLAYYRDLNGSDNESTPAGTAPYGCVPLARQMIQSDLPISDDAFRAALATFVRSQETSAQLQAAYTDWRSCMAAYNYDVSWPNQIGSTGSNDPNTNSESPTAGPTGSVTPTTSQIKESNLDTACQVMDIMPVQQKLERAEVSSLAIQFPQYAARAQEVLSNSSTLGS